MQPIIEISNLTISFHGDEYCLTAIEDLTLSIFKGETLAIIGESGSGKSVLGQAILSILPESAEIQGIINYREKNLLMASDSELESIRGGLIGWVPQNPKMGFNPSMKMWKQIAESMIIHTDSSWSEAKRQAISLLERFKVLPADQWADAYPVSYSGGMLQRAMVAMGTSVNPDVIIADEPTKGVDLLNKSGITDLFLEMKTRGITQILITHDLDFARELADRVAVLYCGQIVEITSKEIFFTHPRHPYSHGLLQSLPQNGLCPIPGNAPPMHIVHTGCRFKDRCSDSKKECKNPVPFFSMNKDYVRCFNYHNRDQPL